MVASSAGNRGQAGINHPAGRQGRRRRAVYTNDPESTNHGADMRTLPFCSSLLVAAFTCAGSAAATTSIATSAHGLSSTVGSGVAPVAAVGGSTSPGYNLSGNLASHGSLTDLGSLNGTSLSLALDSGSIATSAGANGTAPADTSSGSAASSLNSVVLALFTTTMGMNSDVLRITAGAVQASTSVARMGAASSLVGSSQFSNLSISLDGMSLLDLAGTQSVAANFVAHDMDGLTITLNEQVRTGTLGSVERFVTSAIAVRFTNFMAGGQTLNGVVTLGRAQGDLLIDDVPVPEPWAWLQMLAGFGLVGSWQRQQRLRTARPD
jgi:hypothetical protein